jgi:MFS family permease
VTATTAPAAGSPGNRKALVLAAMIFAVAMTFIDQTIVSIAVPKIESELHLSINGVQWVVNGYLLALASTFAFGGRLSDMVGHRRMVVIGVIVFTTASIACGLTPANSIAEGWIVGWRVIQGFGGALMYPAALAIVVSAFPLQERGRAIAIFFGVAGGLTALGPLLGGYLSEWTWRARPQRWHPPARPGLRLECRPRWPGTCTTPPSSAWPTGCAPCCTAWQQ